MSGNFHVAFPSAGSLISCRPGSYINRCGRLFEAAYGFPSLTHLILADCELELIDLCCLVQARLDGKLPRIRHLDISLNRLSDHVGILTRDPLTHREITWENVLCYESCYLMFYYYGYGRKFY